MPCDHSTVTTRFCPECGKPTGGVREPGEIKAMRESIKNIPPPKESGLFMGYLLASMTMLLTLDWVLGEVESDKLIGVLTPKETPNDK